jgi:hypothetical protein
VNRYVEEGRTTNTEINLKETGIDSGIDGDWRRVPLSTVTNL